MLDEDTFETNLFAFQEFSEAFSFTSMLRICFRKVWWKRCRKCKWKRIRKFYFFQIVLCCFGAKNEIFCFLFTVFVFECSFWRDKLVGGGFFNYVTSIFRLMVRAWLFLFCNQIFVDKLMLFKDYGKSFKFVVIFKGHYMNFVEK